MLSRRRFLLSAAASAPTLALHAQRANPAASMAPACKANLPAPILALTDRTADVKPIGTSERSDRMDRARALMNQSGLDAILITSGASLLYFTGAHWYQSERLFAYIIPRSAAPFVVCPALERDHLASLLLNFPERETTLTYLWQENEDPYSVLRRALGEVNISTGTLGIEEQTFFGHAQAIGRALPAIKLVPANPVTAGCRMIKSPAEIACLRLANQITLDVYRAIYLSCSPGFNNHQVADLIEKAYARCGVRGDATCNVGPNTAVPHGSSEPQIIHAREMVMLDDGCTVEGYTSDITRSWVYGMPTEEQRKVFDIVHRAQSAALATARPGAEMQAVDAAARKVIVAAGYGPGYDFFYHRVGHGIGLDMHEWPYLVGGNTQQIKPGMVFSDEPGIYLQGRFGIRLEDDMHITPDGAEFFTAQSPSLEHPFDLPSTPKAT